MTETTIDAMIDEITKNLRTLDAEYVDAIRVLVQMWVCIAAQADFAARMQPKPVPKGGA